ncbi:MAG: hypothetical protein ABIP01_04785 [Candidatus Limnocylindria bacterium]
MRVIRPQALTVAGRRRPLLLALSMLAVGVLAVELTVVGPITASGAAVMAGAAALGLGVGAAWLVRIVRPDRARRVSDALTQLLSATFDDTYTLVVAPGLPVRDSVRLDGILVGPGGVRVLTVREWEGRYRVRGKVWEFDARGRRGWVRCRTNPSFDATALADGVVRWSRQAGIGDVPIRPVIVFPRRHSRIILEEPADEVVTTDNAPWWANAIGRVRRLDPATASRILDAVLDAANPAQPLPGRALADRAS